jgi:uncharacterized ion transporter superfamily protein YfcC
MGTFEKNRRANIPIVVLVIGVVAICGLAIFSFIISAGKFSPEKSKIGVEIIGKINSDIEKFYFYKNAGLSNEEAAKRIGGIFSGDLLTINEENEFLNITYNSVIHG